MDDSKTVHRTQEDLNKEFDEQIQRLQDSAERYDQGNLREAKDMAITLRILFHDSKASKSLRTGVSRPELIADTSLQQPPGRGVFALLVRVYVDPKGPVYVPILDRLGFKAPKVEFSAWWNGVIFGSTEQVQAGAPERFISRRQLICIVANKDGGAHVDPKFPTWYDGLRNGQSMKQHYVLLQGGPDEPFPEKLTTSLLPERPERAAIRQIAHEVLKTYLPGYERYHHAKEGRFEPVWAPEIVFRSSTQ